jgi:hypothetical protein
MTTAMTTDPGTSLPRWGALTEPMTVLTNVALAAVAFVLAVRLGYAAAAGGTASTAAIAFALVFTALAAALGAAAHGIDPAIDREQRDRCWRAALYVSGLVGASSVAAVAFFAARGATRVAILVFAGCKLVALLVTLARRPEFRVAAADYGAALAVLLAGAVYAMVRWNAPAGPWLVAGVLVSLVAGLVQARRVALHRHFNHNDLFHVIQTIALYLFSRGGALLVDR